MSDILLSMKLSCKSFSAPVVHTDKASCTKNPLRLGRETVQTRTGNKERRRNSGDLKRDLCAAELLEPPGGTKQ